MPRVGSVCPRRSGCICTATPTWSNRQLLDRVDLGASSRDGTGRAGSTCGWPESASTTSPPSTSTAASRSRSSSCARQLGIDGDDPRGLTLTGGLPYFGGPGNSYSLHGIAETVCRDAGQARDIRLRRRQRRHHEQVLGRHLLDRCRPTGAPTAARRCNDEIAALPKVAVTSNADGPATIETYSVRYDWPVRTGIIVGRLDADGCRFMAITDDEDLVGADVRRRSARYCNRRDVDRARQPRAPGLVPRKQSKVEIRPSRGGGLWQPRHRDRRFASRPLDSNRLRCPRLPLRPCACGSSKTRAMSGLIDGMTFPFQ